MTSFSEVWSIANSVWTLFGVNVGWIMSNFLLHLILEMSGWSSVGLISVKKWFIFRKHEVLQNQFEQFLEQILVWIVSNFVHSILEMPDLELWKSNFSQKVVSLSKAWSTANSVWTAFGATFWMNCVKTSCSFDSRDARFGALKVWFQSKSGFFLESMKECKLS